MKKYLFIIFLFFISSCNINSNVVLESDINIETYFCPQDLCLEKMITLIDNSNEIKCAFYDLDIPLLIKKLKEKNADVVIENDNAIGDFHTGYSYALMHNKFCIFDKKIVLTGSMNPTIRGNYYNNNNIIIIESTTIAQNYVDEFYELKKDEFGKGNNVKNPIIKNNEILIENYFCPEDNCKAHVIENLQKAEKSIYFMTFSFTDEDIGNLLWNKDYLGLDVKGIMEQKQISQYSRYDDLKGFSILDHNKYTMHHKVFIIDNETVISGSYNPTKNANEKNDENIIIIHDKKIAKKFFDEFKRLYNKKETFPKKTSNIIIKKILYDAIGKDDNNEYIILKNIGNEIINLDYYFISDNKTNSKISGKIKPNKEKKITPKFSLKNNKGILFLKKNDNVIDYIFWEGIWNLEAKEGEILKRIDEKKINQDSWIVIKD